MKPVLVFLALTLALSGPASTVQAQGTVLEPQVLPPNPILDQPPQVTCPLFLGDPYYGNCVFLVEGIANQYVRDTYIVVFYVPYGVYAVVCVATGGEFCPCEPYCPVTGLMREDTAEQATVLAVPCDGDIPCWLYERAHCEVQERICPGPMPCPPVGPPDNYYCNLLRYAIEEALAAARSALGSSGTAQAAGTDLTSFDVAGDDTSAVGTTGPCDEPTIDCWLWWRLRCKWVDQEACPSEPMPCPPVGPPDNYYCNLVRYVLEKVLLAGSVDAAHSAQVEEGILDEPPQVDACFPILWREDDPVYDNCMAVQGIANQYLHDTYIVVFYVPYGVYAVACVATGGEFCPCEPYCGPLPTGITVIADDVAGPAAPPGAAKGGIAASACGDATACWIAQRLNCEIIPMECPAGPMPCPPVGPPDNYYCNALRYAVDEGLQAVVANGSGPVAASADPGILDHPPQIATCTQPEQREDDPIYAACMLAQRTANEYLYSTYIIVFYVPYGVYAVLCVATSGEFCPCEPYCAFSLAAMPLAAGAAASADVAVLERPPQVHACVPLIPREDDPVYDNCMAVQGIANQYLHDTYIVVFYVPYGVYAVVCVATGGEFCPCEPYCSLTPIAALLAAETTVADGACVDETACWLPDRILCEVINRACPGPMPCPPVGPPDNYYCNALRYLVGNVLGPSGQGS